MKVMLRLEREDIYKEIPFSVICEAREGALWNTGRRKRLWDELFTEKEKEARKFLCLPLIKTKNRE